MKYPKINSLYKRHTGGDNKGKFIFGNYSNPEVEYLKDNLWICTEKLDGTNIRIYNDNTNIIINGRTDKAVVPQSIVNWIENNILIERLQEVFVDDCSKFVLYGEGVGPKIQKIGKEFGHNRFILFDVLYNNKLWLTHNQVCDIAERLDIEYAPIVNHLTIDGAIDLVTTGFESLFGKFDAEGVVAKTLCELKDRHGNRIITKIKTVDFR